MEENRPQTFEEHQAAVEHLERSLDAMTWFEWSLRNREGILG